ncbi:MAG: MFS transporter [Elusimicrobiota bacterium]|nr:MFS transporter [Elusimicrobiota bacterium]
MRLIHRREFRRLIAGYALSTAGDAGVRMLLAWVALEQRGVAAMSGVFVGSAAACLLGPLVGRALDRHPVRNILSAACLARAVLLLALALLTPQTVAAHAAVFAFLSALFSLAHGPAVSKTIPSMFTPEKMHEANASSGVAFLAASAAGPALGGAVLARHGLGASCAIFAAVFLAATPLAHFATLPQAPDQPAEGRSPDIVDSFSALLRMPLVLTLAALGIAVNFCLAPLNVALAPHLLSLGSGPQGFGGAMAVLVVGAIIGNLAAGSRLMETARWEDSILAGLGAVACGLVAVGSSTSPLQASAAVLIVGAALPFIQVPVATRLQSEVPAAQAGRVFSTLNSATLLAAPLAAAGVGLLLKRLPPAPVFFGAAAACALLCAAWGLGRRERPNAG